MKSGSLPSGHRWLPVSPVVRLETGAEPWVVEVLREGYAIPFRMPPPLSPTPIMLDSYSPQSVKGRPLDEEIQALRHKGTVEPAPPTPGFFSRMLVADHRPLNSEPRCGSDSFSDGDISDGSACCPQERLNGLHRSEGCVLSDPDPPCVSQVSQVHSWREDLAVPGPLLRSVHSSAGVHSFDGTCVRVPPSAGNPDAPVSGRLADSCVISGGSLLGKGQGSQPLSGAGNCCQPREVDSSSISDYCLPGNQDRLTDFPGFGDSLEDRKVLLNSRRISVLKGAVCKVLESLAKPPHLSVSHCSEWPASNESSSIGSKSRLGFSGRGYPGSLGSFFSGRLEEGISLSLRSPDQMFWSDVSNLGWRATVEDQFVSGVWLEGEVSLSINQRELLAVERGLRALCTCLEGRVVAVFSDNTTVVAYLRRQGAECQKLSIYCFTPATGA